MVMNSTVNKFYPRELLDDLSKKDVLVWIPATVPRDARLEFRGGGLHSPTDNTLCLYLWYMSMRFYDSANLVLKLFGDTVGGRVQVFRNESGIPSFYKLV